MYIEYQELCQFDVFRLLLHLQKGVNFQGIFLHLSWIFLQIQVMEQMKGFCQLPDISTVAIDLDASISCSVVSDSLRPLGLQPIRLLCLWNSPGMNTGVGFHSLLQGIFLTQGSNPDLLHCRQILYHLRHQLGKSQETERLPWWLRW